MRVGRQEVSSAMAFLFVLLSMMSGSIQAAEFSSEFPPLERIWVGPDLFANRMLDWRVRDGRLECLEGSRAKPMRTVHLLTLSAGEEPESFEMRVRTGPIRAGARHANTWAGFLLGVGGEHVDFRLSSLAHHWPAEDGGLIAALDGTGRLIFRDNSHSRGPRGPVADIPLDAWPLLASSQENLETWPPALELVLKVEPSGQGNYRLALQALDSGGRVLNEAQLENVNSEQVSGNLALVSHQSPEQEGPGYWFESWQVEGPGVQAHPERSFGPIFSTQYTLNEGTLKMTAQMAPLGQQDRPEAWLEIMREGSWRTVATGNLVDHSFTVPFRVQPFQPGEDTPFRVVYRLRDGEDSFQVHRYEGTIRKPPLEKEELVVAAFTGHHISAQGQGHWNQSHIWYPHNELVKAVAHHSPDLLFFSGDQIYEGGLAGIVREPPEDAVIDYLYHWLRWCWAFRDLTRDRPSITIPDDHDVYHGNIWGAGGRAADGYGKQGQDQGGYTMHPMFVNAVHRTQVSHLPDPADPEPIEQGITPYHTSLNYAGVDFAIIADRMWKSSPSVMVPEGNVVNGWFEKPGFDVAADSDVPGANLLGERQLGFLQGWVHDWSGGEKMKVLLSQTIFANVATIPEEAINDTVVPSMRIPEKGEYIEGDKLATDADSNGWPQSGRNKALDILRKGFVFHIAGDQHLGSFIQYGVNEWGDAGFALCVPSIANTWPRRWFPPEPGLNRKPGSPRYTGDFRDGFGNLITVHAVSNPSRTGLHPDALYSRAPGYGIVRLNRTTRDITSEVWPRWVDPTRSNEQYPGWPITVNQFDNYSRPTDFYLPVLSVQGVDEPVVQVVQESTGEILYSVRIRGQSFKPAVWEEGSYMIRISKPGGSGMKTLTGIRPAESETLEVTFEAEDR